MPLRIRRRIVAGPVTFRGGAVVRRPLRSRPVAVALLVALLVLAGTGVVAGPSPVGAQARPLRVLLVGDEIMAAAAPPAVAMLEATGRVDAEMATRPGSGLASRFDWPATVDQLLRVFPADVVVAHFGGADSPPLATGPDGAPLGHGSGAWLNRWGQGTMALVDVVVAHDTRLALVVPPPDGDPSRADTTEMISLGQQGLLYGFPDHVSFIDPREVLSGPGGGFASAAPGPDGTVHPLRLANGYGLAPEGGRRVAELIVAELTRQWCLEPGAAERGCVPAPGAPAPATPAPGDRPRILAAGDSLLFQVAPRLEWVLERSGRAWVHVSHRSTAGLLSTFYDWRGRIRTDVDAFQPDVVLLQFQGGYRPPYHRQADGSEILPGTLVYFARFTQESVDLTAELTATGALVVWVLGPEHYVVGPDGRLTTSAVWDELAAQFGDRVVGLDGWEALGQVPGEGLLDVATSRPLRLPDRIHFTQEGADRYTTMVATLLDGLGCLDGPGACRR